MPRIKPNQSHEKKQGKYDRNNEPRYTPSKSEKSARNSPSKDARSSPATFNAVNKEKVTNHHSYDELDRPLSSRKKSPDILKMCSPISSPRQETLEQLSRLESAESQKDKRSSSSGANNIPMSSSRRETPEPLDRPDSAESQKDKRSSSSGANRSGDSTPGRAPSRSYSLRSGRSTPVEMDDFHKNRGRRR